ncbi:radical SAM protein [Patescibacteria group bacterium]
MADIKTAWLVITYSCNNLCNYCYARNMIKQKYYMDFDYIIQVLDELSRIGVKECLLIGGEPTIYPHLIEIIKYGSSLGLQMKVVSNGRMLKNRKFLYVRLR